MQAVSNRGRRALVLMGLAAGAAVVVGVISLRQASAPAPTPPVPVPRWQLTTASFGDAQRGAVSLQGEGRVATFLTSDGGRTWRPFSSRPGVTAFLDRDHAVTVDLGPTNQFRTSADAGRTWRTALQPVQLSGAAVTILPGGVLAGGPFFLDPADAWWFGTPPGAGGRALWRTSDGGATWIDLAPAGIPAVEGAHQPVFVDPLRGALAMSADGPDTVPSLLVTRDGGRTWGSVSLAPPPAVVAPGQGAVVVPTLLARGGVLVLSLDVAVDRSSGPSPLLGHLLATSEDAGLTWGPWTAMPSTSAPAATMASDGAGRLLLADGRRLWSSPDLGRTWSSRPVSGPAGQLSAVASALGGALFVITSSGPAGAASRTLLRSLDGGGRWTEVRLPTPS